MNIPEVQEKHSWTWYSQNPRVEWENGKRVIKCPFCELRIESAHYEHDMDMAIHIDSQHPEHITHPGRKEGTGIQKTLEGF